MLMATIQGCVERTRGGSNCDVMFMLMLMFMLMFMLMLIVMLMCTIQGGVWKGREEVASLRPKGKEFLREEGQGPIVEAQYKRYNHKHNHYDDDCDHYDDDCDDCDDYDDDCEWMTSTELGEGGSGQKAFMLLPTKMSSPLLSSSSSSLSSVS